MKYILLVFILACGSPKPKTEYMGFRIQMDSNNYRHVDTLAVIHGDTAFILRGIHQDTIWLGSHGLEKNIGCAGQAFMYDSTHYHWNADSLTFDSIYEAKRIQPILK